MYHCYYYLQVFIHLHDFCCILTALHKCFIVMLCCEQIIMVVVIPPVIFQGNCFVLKKLPMWNHSLDVAGDCFVAVSLWNSVFKALYIAQLSSRTSNALNSLVSSEQIRFKQLSETVSTDGWVPDEIWARFPTVGPATGPTTVSVEVVVRYCV